MKGRDVVNNQLKIWPVLRDVIILTVLTALGGFIVGFASTSGRNSPLYFYSLALSNSLFCIIGFTVSGCLAVGNRWRHLALVATIVWAVSIFNVIFLGLTIILWEASFIGVAIFALIGGAISLLFKPKTLMEMPSNTGNDTFYDEVARELQGKSMVSGLWTKAFAEMGGDDAKARALYIKYRVAQLAEQHEQERAKIKAAEKKQYAEMEAARRQKLTLSHRLIYGFLGIVCLLVCGVFVLGAIACIGTSFDKTAILDSDDLTLYIGLGIFFLFIALLFGALTRKCFNET